MMAALAPRETDCVIDIAQTHDNFHAHVTLADCHAGPGDIVEILGAPDDRADWAGGVFTARARLYRAGPLRRLWLRLTAPFRLLDLCEVGFMPKEDL